MRDKFNEIPFRMTPHLQPGEIRKWINPCGQIEEILIGEGTDLDDLVSKMNMQSGNRK